MTLRQMIEDPHGFHKRLCGAAFWEDALSANTALMSILRRHAPDDWPDMPNCSSCERYMRRTPYPCPTVLDIAEAYGVSPKWLTPREDD